MENFLKEMKIVLKEKQLIYKNTWKNCNLNLLFDKLNIQFELLKNHAISIKESKRILIHIANYSYFIYERFNKIE